MNPEDVVSADAEGNVTIAQPSTVVVPIEDLEANVTQTQTDLANAAADFAHIDEMRDKARTNLDAAQTRADDAVAIRDAAQAKVDIATADAQADT